MSSPFYSSMIPVFIYDSDSVHRTFKFGCYLSQNDIITIKNESLWVGIISIRQSNLKQEPMRKHVFVLSPAMSSPIYSSMITTLSQKSFVLEQSFPFPRIAPQKILFSSMIVTVCYYRTRHPGLSRPVRTAQLWGKQPAGWTNERARQSVWTNHRARCRVNSPIQPIRSRLGSTRGPVLTR